MIQALNFSPNPSNPNLLSQREKDWQRRCQQRCKPVLPRSPFLPSNVCVCLLYQVVFCSPLSTTPELQPILFQFSSCLLLPCSVRCCVMLGQIRDQVVVCRSLF